MVGSIIVFISTLIILISLNGALDQNQFQSQALIDKNSLNYGDNCSYETEDQRIKILTPFFIDLEKLSVSQVSAQKGEIFKALDEISQLPGKLCDLFKHLRCTSSGTCNCSSVIEGSLSRQNFEYKDGKCMLTNGSVCHTPDDSSPQVNYILNEAKMKEPVICRTGTTCIVKESGMSCTASIMKEELELRTKKAQQASGNLSPTEDFELSLKQVYKLFREEFCVCSGDKFYISSIAILFSLLTKLFI